MVHVATNSSKESKREGIRDVLKFAPNAFPQKQIEPKSGKIPAQMMTVRKGVILFLFV